MEMNNNNIIKYELSYLLNILETEYPNHIFKLKTKKIYTHIYNYNYNYNNTNLVDINNSNSAGSVGLTKQQSSSLNCESKSIPKNKIIVSTFNKKKINSNVINNIKRKIYVEETDAFSAERMIQDIRNVLGKVSLGNKNYVIEILKKNIGFIDKYNENNIDTNIDNSNYCNINNNINKCIDLLLQYANLCLEWNDLYLEIYHHVYYTNVNINNNIPFHKKLYIQCENNIWNYKVYETNTQTIFFRCSNIDLFIKFSMKYPSYCIEFCKNKNVKSFEDWFILYYKLLIDKLIEISSLGPSQTNSVDSCEEINSKLEWIEIIIQYFNSFIKLSDKYLQNSCNKIKTIYNNIKYKDLFDQFDNIILDKPAGSNKPQSETIPKSIPMKIQFKWMEITDILKLQ
jgi:hypothetical protein